MGLHVSSMVSFSEPRDYTTLKRIREFVEATADMGDQTKVKLEVRVDEAGTVEDFTMGANYGDVTHY